MELVVLDRFNEGAATCLLCKTSLAEYVLGLPDDFREYYIQRGIVTNRFLDNLWDTLEGRRHIPPIVLVGDGDLPTASVGSVLNVGQGIKVLDGLQRSHRLKEIWDTIEFVDHEFVDHSQVTVARMAREHAARIREKGINLQIFQKVLEFSRKAKTGKILFEQNSIWLEVWFGLSEAQQIRKMLILNAGHKSVNIKHQIELIFWSNFEELQRSLSPATIVREKDKSSTTYSKSRASGEFHFAHLISAFVSLAEGKPVTTNAEFSATQSFKGEKDLDEALLDIDDRLLASFTSTLVTLDNHLQTELGTRWLGREVVLVGIFSAIGAYSQKTPGGKPAALEAFKARVPNFVSVLNLDGFESWRNSLELSKVNIGSVNKRVVFHATRLFLEETFEHSIDWQEIYRSVVNDAA